MAGQDDEGTLLESPEEGIIGIHPERKLQPFLASPATAKTFNVLGIDIEPIACLQLGDILFDFDSSFVRPEVAKMLVGLPDLRAKRKNPKGVLPPVGIWGHADPVGTEDYNKQLSGRRAKAVYGVLLNDAGIWEELFNSPFGGDNWQHNASIAGLRDFLGLPAGTPRKAVFEAYLKTLCPVPLTKADFLGQGADPKGRADFQGCSKFNPLVLLSTEDNKDLSKDQRDKANLLNRRVVIYLFRPGVKVTPSLWPCPSALDTTAACHKRLFLDFKARMTPGDERREHTSTADKTFACRFYDRIGGPSPCERVLKIYRVRLFDVQANPLPSAPFFLTDGKSKFFGRAKDDAFLTVRDLKVPATVTIKWNRPKAGDSPLSPPPKETDNFEFVLRVFIDIDDANKVDAALARLHNLGYDAGAKQKDDVALFQQDYKDRFGLPLTDGTLDDPTMDALEKVNDECDPNVKPPRGKKS
jgi:hypothetical protein